MEIKRCYDTIIGASVGWNQLVPLTAISSDAKAGVTGTNNSDGTVTITGTATGDAQLKIMLYASPPVGHKFLLTASDLVGSVTTFQYSYWKNNGATLIRNSNYGNLVYSLSEGDTNIGLWLNVKNGQTYNMTLVPQVTDLTQKFGSSIANYIYNLESATTGSGIAKLREWGFLKGYQAFNSGSIESVEVTGKKVTGKNILRTLTLADFDNAETYGLSSYIEIPLHAGTYTISTNAPTGYIWSGPSVTSGYVRVYDGNPSTFSLNEDGVILLGILTTDKQTALSYNIQIELGSTATEYEPYTSQSYDYGTDTLRGIFKLDANNNLYADGDVKTSDGTITRYYGTRAYQSGDESLADAITDGTTTVYKLTTPTTEQGDPFPSPQIVYPDGTEEYVTENGVPVGHETRYEL